MHFETPEKVKYISIAQYRNEKSPITEKSEQWHVKLCVDIV